MLWDRVTTGVDHALIGPSGIPVAEVIRRLETGASPAQVAAALGLEPADLIATLGQFALGDTGADGPPLVRSSPRRRRLAGALGEDAWSLLLAGAPRNSRLALAAGLLQVHDFWDASHEAAQQADDLGERSFSAYWHAIAHRREPDSGNASYWVRRVGAQHPVYASLASAARPLIEGYGDPSLTARLLAGGAWNPSAFVDLCADGRPGPNVASLALDLQRLEMRLLLEATAEAALKPSE